MQGKYNNIAIKGIAAVVPENVIDNMSYAEILGEKKVKKHIRMTGVEERHKLEEHQKASDLAMEAAKRVLAHTGWDKEEIQALVYVTQSPDMDKPATAFLIQKRLEIGKNCIAFDVNLGCSGFVAGIQIIAGLLHNAGGKGLLLIGDGLYGEEREHLVDQLLFGDAGSAIAVEVEEDHPLLYRQQSDGSRFEVIHKDKGAPDYMDGNAVFAFTLIDVAESIKETMEAFSIEDGDVDYYLLHQGQKMILSNLAEICKMPDEKVLYSMEKYGNTAGSSIPVTMCANRERYDKGKLNMFCCGYGIGLSWGSIYMTIEKKDILDIGVLRSLEGGENNVCQDKQMSESGK